MKHILYILATTIYVLAIYTIKSTYVNMNEASIYK